MWIEVILLFPVSLYVSKYLYLNEVVLYAVHNYC